jgi:two-component system, NarL family, sensor histidine kinase DevS
MPNRAERWLMELMADRAMRVLDASNVLVLRERNGDLHVAASVGRGSVSANVIPVQGTALGDLYRAGDPYSVEHPLRDQGAFLRELGLEAQSALIEPLGIDGPGGGMILALRRDSGLRKGDDNALRAVAASLTEQLMAERNAETERLRYGAQARERERERWARELHDETVQGLGVLRMQLANARDSGDPDELGSAVNDVTEGLQREIMGIRHLITELRPAALDDLGLEAALQALARRAEAVYGLEVETRVEFDAQHVEGRLDAELETTVYRIIQEALNNVSRHAEATSATVTVVEHDGGLEATVADNGKGLPPSREEPFVRQNGRAEESDSPVPSGGYGLPGMRERAELVGGDLELESSPGQGTTLRLRVPLAGRAETPSA